MPTGVTRRGFDTAFEGGYKAGPLAGILRAGIENFASWRGGRVVEGSRLLSGRTV